MNLVQFDIRMKIIEIRNGHTDCLSDRFYSAPSMASIFDGASPLWGLSVANQ